jgi:hypothetical protein
MTEECAGGNEVQLEDGTGGRQQAGSALCRALPGPIRSWDPVTLVAPWAVARSLLPIVSIYASDTDGTLGLEVQHLPDALRIHVNCNLVLLDPAPDLWYKRRWIDEARVIMGEMIFGIPRHGGEGPAVRTELINKIAAAQAVVGPLERHESEEYGQDYDEDDEEEDHINEEALDSEGPQGREDIDRARYQTPNDQDVEPSVETQTANPDNVDGTELDHYEDEEEDPEVDWVNEEGASDWEE